MLGQSGSGKSSWVQKRLREIPRFILWDTLGEYKNFDIVETRRELVEYVDARGSGLIQVVFNCVNEDEETALNFTCRLAVAIEHICLIVEEVDAYATPASLPGDLRALLKRGRHAGVDLIFISRRPAEINRLITAQSRRFVCFRMAEPSDIRYMKSVIGEAAEELPALPLLNYVDWRHGTIERGEIKWTS